MTGRQTVPCSCTARAIRVASRLVRAKETNDLPVKSEKSPISKTTRSVRLPSQCNIRRIIDTKVRILQLLALTLGDLLHHQNPCLVPLQPRPARGVLRTFSWLSDLLSGLADTQRSLRKASGESPASFAIPPIVKALIGFPRGIVRRRSPFPITMWPLCRSTENPTFSRARTASLWEMPGILGIARGGQTVTSSR